MGGRHGRRVGLRLLTVLLVMLVGLVPVRAQASYYTDVADDAWYAEAVNWVSRNGTMIGYADGSFGPEKSLLREEAAAVFCNYLAPGAKGRACGLRDVERGVWYTDCVDWAVDTGTMTGYGDGTFGVGDTLTREQLAAIMARACGADLASVDTSKFNALSDHASTSEWARTSVAWAVQHGVINGMPSANGSRKFAPQDTVTRAQMAAIMMNAANEGLLGNDSTGNKETHIIDGHDTSYTRPDSAHESQVSVRLSEAYVTLYDDGELVLSADDATDSGRTVRYHGTWSGFNTYEGDNSDWSQLRKVTSRCKIWANDNDNLVFLAMHSNLTDISGLSSWDVSKVTNMTNVFVGCSSLTDISPISGWDTSSVLYMYEMFGGCSSLSNLTPIEGWDVSSVIDGGMNSMFGGTAAGVYPSWYKG